MTQQLSSEGQKLISYKFSCNDKVFKDKSVMSCSTEKKIQTL